MNDAESCAKFEKCGRKNCVNLFVVCTSMFLSAVVWFIVATPSTSQTQALYARYKNHLAIRVEAVFRWLIVLQSLADFHHYVTTFDSWCIIPQHFARWVFFLHDQRMTSRAFDWLCRIKFEVCSLLLRSGTQWFYTNLWAWLLLHKVGWNRLIVCTVWRSFSTKTLWDIANVLQHVRRSFPWMYGRLCRSKIWETQQLTLRFDQSFYRIVIFAPLDQNVKYVVQTTILTINLSGRLHIGLCRLGQ